MNVHFAVRNIEGAVDEQSVFDVPAARNLNSVRQAFIADFIAAVRANVPLVSVLDVGCGVGHFARFLKDLQFDVLATDGREENVQEARSRNPEIKFLPQDVEDQSITQLGSFDLVLCLGLLYHLENPFRAIRNLFSVTKKVLLVETMYVPNSQSMMDLLDEAAATNQGLNYVAFYPSEICLIKMLYRAGFKFVYRFSQLPDVEPFKPTRWRKQSRTFLVGSNLSLAVPNLVLANEPFRPHYGDTDPWKTGSSRVREYCSAKLSNLRVLAARILRPGKSTS
jgi:SAM-dependent methyltransferase